MNFRKISFFVAAKHAGLGENDFLKSFSPKTNAPLNSTLKYRTITSLIIASNDEKNHQVEDLISLDG